ncbi:uncharacterized protein G2W53_041278 [Senna tora]|uniref:Uncharacterized protein n=1 Tax=Senna tora TaxID=362788 RepID=A0A834SF83_9FABA|nr:uncharacterized protein G2W53_041278 [Senna tora]
MADLENRMCFVEKEMKVVKVDMRTIKDCMREIHVVLVRLTKRGEEEGRLELNNASVFFIKNETEEKMKATLYSPSTTTLYSPSTATTEGDWKLEEEMIPIIAPGSSPPEVVFYLPNIEIAWKELENGCPDVNMPKKRYCSRSLLSTAGEEGKVKGKNMNWVLDRIRCLLWAATGGSAAAGPVGPHRRDCRRRCLPSVPLPVVSDVGGSPESLYAFLSSVSRVGHLRTPRFAAGDSQTWTTAASDRGSRWYAGVLTAGSLLLSGFAFLGVYGGVSVFALDFGIEKAFGEYGGSIVFISLAVKDGSKASRQDKPSSWVSEKVSYADIVKNLEGGVGRRDDNGSEGRSRNGIRESLAPQNKFKKTLKIHLDPNGRRRVEWVLERRVQQPRSPLRLALSKGPPEIHKSQQQPKKRVNWALHDTTRKNGTKRANESRVEELGQVKAQSSLKKVVNGSDGVRNEAIRPLALTWVAKGVDKVKKGTEVMGSVLGPVSGEGSEYNSSTHASSKGKEVIQEVDLGPSCSGTKGEMTSHSFFDAEALSSDTSDTETVDDDSLISHFENEEGLLIEQLEREFMEEQKQQNKEAEVPLDEYFESARHPS